MKPVHGAVSLRVSGLYLRHVLAVVRDLGGDVGAWLDACGVEEATLGDAELVLTLQQLEALIESAIASTKERALGLLVGKRLTATAHGILSYAAFSSSTLQQAVELVERFVPLRLSILRLTYQKRPRDLRVLYSETVFVGALHAPLAEITLVALRNLLEALTHGACPPTRVCFDFAEPEYAALAQDVFGCEVRYAQGFTGLVLPAAALDLPLQMGDPAVAEQMALIGGRELDKLRAHESVAASVQRVLREQQPDPPRLEAVARRLHTTPRTLHRRLAAEGTSFHAIVESVRHKLAVEYLVAGHHTIKQVAHVLGYSDVANFRRAFKRWEGVPPIHSSRSAASRGSARRRGTASPERARGRTPRPGRHG